jgi:hypothetical protein
MSRGKWRRAPKFHWYDDAVGAGSSELSVSGSLLRPEGAIMAAFSKELIMAALNDGMGSITLSQVTVAPRHGWQGRALRKRVCGRAVAACVVVFGPRYRIEPRLCRGPFGRKPRTTRFCSACDTTYYEETVRLVSSPVYTFWTIELLQLPNACRPPTSLFYTSEQPSS